MMSASLLTAKDDSLLASPVTRQQRQNGDRTCERDLTIGLRADLPLALVGPVAAVTLHAEPSPTRVRLPRHRQTRDDL